MLKLSDKSIEFYLNKLYKKMNVTNRVEMIRYALMNQLIHVKSWIAPVQELIEKASAYLWVRYPAAILRPFKIGVLFITNYKKAPNLNSAKKKII